MDIDKIAKAIEADAGIELPSLRQALSEAQEVAGKTTTAEQILTRSARAKTGLSQQAFANLIGTPVATLRDWEQGRFAPPGGVLCLLKLIYNHPDLIHELESIAA
jgi:putative transcriptional regulator